MMFFNSIPINPDVDDPEQLPGESIQSFLTLVVQLQWLVALGRLVTHAQVTNGGIILITRPTFMDISIFFKTTPHSSFHHLHTHTHTHKHTHKALSTNYIYISTYYYACQHKNMLHPPQEGSNSSLAYGTLLGVLW